MNKVELSIYNWLEDRPTMKENNQHRERLFNLLHGEVLELLEASENKSHYELSHDLDFLYEIADVAIYLNTIAQMLRVNLDKLILEKMALNHLRYPASDYQEGSDFDDSMRTNRRRVKHTRLIEKFKED